MATLITFQFNSTVLPPQVAMFRRRLHDLENFAMCMDDAQGRCMDLPGNSLIANYDDLTSAKTAFEKEARYDALLSSIDMVIYAAFDHAQIDSIKICANMKCSFPPSEMAQVSETSPDASTEDFSEMKA